MSTDSPPSIEIRVSAAVDETLDAAVDWTLDETNDGYRITLSDRVVEIDQIDGPASAVRWVLSLQVDGEIVSKFGPYESTDDLIGQLRSVLTSDVFYTVCCDGKPDN